MNIQPLLPFRLAVFIFTVFTTISGYAQNGWMHVYSPADPSEHFSDIYAIDKNNVILSSEWGQVYRSTNGCQSVEKYQVPGNFSIFGDIDFTNAQNGFIGGGCWFPTSECITSAMLRTTDGGATWSVEQLSQGLGVFVTVNALPSGEVFALGDYTGVHHFDPQTGEWENLGSPSDIVGYNVDLRFVDNENGFLLHHGWNSDTLYRTANGGSSWTFVHADMPAMFYTANMHFFDTQKGLLPGTGGILYQTLDGGVTWAPIKEFGVNEMMHHIEFVDDQTGYLAVFNTQTQFGRIYRTDDAGETWTPDLESTDSSFFSRFHFVDKNNGYALDSRNQIFRRTGESAVKVVQAEIPLKISPNPVLNTLTVSRQSSSSTNQTLFLLCDVLGRKVLQQPLSDDITQIECGHLANGPYWYTCGGMAGKILVQH